MTKPDVLLLSGYHAASHKYWTNQLTTELAHYNWTQATLPDRHFYWRIRSNALTFAFQQPKLKSNYQLLLATSMVDLCNLRGLLPGLAAIPSILYFHENQFAYPERAATLQGNGNAKSNLINAQLTSIYSALVADQLVFNSSYNRDSFCHGATALLKKMPDGIPGDLLSDLQRKSVVIPVPIHDALFALRDTAEPLKDRIADKSAVEIVWNHRWEYDKQPQVFFSVIEKLISAGYQIKLHVMGQSFRQIPACFEEFKKVHGDIVATWGYQPIERYHQILGQADIVVSTALHDFQGLGMLEAIAAGCTPVAPDRMAYPEYIDNNLLYTTGVVEHIDLETANPEQTETDSCYEMLVSVIESSQVCQAKVHEFSLSALIPKYDELIRRLVI